MIDRDKTIKGLEEAIAFFRDRVTGGMYDKWLRASVDALALLKAQEPVEPTIDGDADGPFKSWWYVCSACKQPIYKGDKYCKWCGRMMKWDG